ncbi:MAG: penicillin-binding transpeptidase domain-containing protein, partial [Fibrobacterota bacterium]
RIIGPWGNLVSENRPFAIRQVIAPRTASELRMHLKGVVDSGTGRPAAIEGCSIGGKTGTAQKIDKANKTYLSDRFYSSFIGFMPVDSPEYVCMVLLDDPRKVHSGGKAAGPIFKEIMKKTRLLSGIKSVPVKPENGTGDPEIIILRNFKGEDASEAAAYAETNGIRLITNGKGGTIRAQSPPSGARMNRGDTAFVFLSESNDKVGVPSLKGLSLREAVRVVYSLGLKAVVRGGGSVVRQIPAPGEEVGDGTRVFIECSYRKQV